jgi:hypothetical protein
MSRTFPACAISSTIAAGGRRLIKRLGFNTIQGSMVCMEHGERSRGGEDVSSGNES